MIKFVIYMCVYLYCHMNVDINECIDIENGEIPTCYHIYIIYLFIYIDSTLFDNFLIY